MKQVVAMGRWSKSDQQWKTVVALHRIGSSAKATAARRGERRESQPPADDRESGR